MSGVKGMKKGVNRKKENAAGLSASGEAGERLEQPPFEMMDERLEGNLSGIPADVEAETGADATTEAAPAKRTRKKKDVEATKEPDDDLIMTMTIGTNALADMGVKLARFSEPGEQWRVMMGRLAARWLSKFEEGWIATHPLEGAIVLHLGFWIGPNVIMRAVEYAESTAKRKRENLDRRRTSAIREDNGSDKTSFAS